MVEQMLLLSFLSGMIKKLISILQKSASKKWRSFFVLPIVILIITLILSLYSLLYLYSSSYNLTIKEVSIPKGATTWKTLSHLNKEGILPHPLIALIGSVTTHGSVRIQAGEYLFTAGISAKDVMRMLREGQVIEHIITFPEGRTAYEIMAQINSDERLSGENVVSVKEGSLFPSTYNIQRNQSKRLLIQKMHKKMNNITSTILQSNQNPFIKTAEELIIFASILEKEAATLEELPRISGVFVNRLKKKMRLQSCPTAMYAKTLGKEKFSRPLTYNDLEIDSDYNTYQREGLPIGPICCPGLRALEAAAHPLDTNELFFVFDGKKHYFSVTYQQHLERKRQIKTRAKD